MSDLTIILLPGLDGTSHLFGSFLKRLPSYLNPLTISYPTDIVMDYEELRNYVMDRLPGRRDFVLLAESFSWPLAVQIAVERPEIVKALILVATFVENPLLHLGKYTRHLGHFLGFEWKIPRRLIRYLLLSNDAGKEQVTEILDVLRTVKPPVLNHRLRMVLNLDARKAFCKCTVPMLYLSEARDKLVTRASLKTILELRSEVEHIPIDAPHMILQRAPALASEAVEAFLRKFELS
jgi:pimeloyl-ACP methyl ester carboxylesterase